MKGPQNPIIQRLEALKSFDLPRIEKASKPDQFKARASKPFPFEEKSSMQPESSRLAQTPKGWGSPKKLDGNLVAAKPALYCISMIQQRQRHSQAMKLSRQIERRDLEKGFVER
jgi:hypothetical protein